MQISRKPRKRLCLRKRKECPRVSICRWMFFQERFIVMTVFNFLWFKTIFLTIVSFAWLHLVVVLHALKRHYPDVKSNANTARIKKWLCYSVTVLQAAIYLYFCIKNIKLSDKIRKPINYRFKVFVLLLLLVLCK